MIGPRTWRVAAGALVVAVSLQAVRGFFPPVFRLGEETDFVGAGVFALAVFAAPVLAPLARRLISAPAALLVAVLELAMIRLFAQWIDPIPLWLSTVLVAVALVATALVLIELQRTQPGAPSGAVLVPLLLGLALDTAIRGAFRTWDVLWQPGVAAALVAVLLVLAMVAAVVASDLWRPTATGDASGWSFAAIGPFLLLHVPFLQSPAYLASQGDVSIATAVALILLGDAVALLLIGSGPAALRGGPAGLAALVALAAVGYAIPRLADGPILAVVPTGIVLSALALGSALARRRPTGGAAARAGLGIAAGAVGFLGLAFVFQLHFEMPLPVSNAWVPPLAGALLALGWLARVEVEPRGEPEGVLPAAAALALLVVPLGLWLARPDPVVTEGSGDRLRLVSYNIHLAVNTDGQLDPEAIARVIEAQDPDVVLLQEVGRGWAIGGATDLAEWMAYRLGLGYRYQPAADRQFGNAIFSRLPILASDGATLPFGQGPQLRSYLQATIDVGGGAELEVFDIHLQHQEMSDTRLMQIEAVLRAWDGAVPAVIAGDVNAQPDDPEIARFTDAGLISAQDETGNGELPTASIPAFPGDRVDWIFGAGVGFEDFVTPQTRASDHLPLVVTVVIR